MFGRITRFPHRAKAPDLLPAIPRQEDCLSIEVRGREDASVLSTRVAAALRDAIGYAEPLDPDLLSLEGMSGRKYRSFINRLIGALPDARYLEVGCWRGSTLCAAMFANKVKVFCVDNWAEFGGPKAEFFANVERFKTPEVDFAFQESDFRAVDYQAAGRFNVYLFDGPHGHQDHYDALLLPMSALDEEFVFIVDDWNAPFVREGSRNAIADLGLVCFYAVEIRTTQTDEHAFRAGAESDWHNGYCIGVYRKPAAAQDAAIQPIPAEDAPSASVSMLCSNAEREAEPPRVPFFEGQSLDLTGYGIPSIELKVSTLENAYLLVGPGRDGIVFTSDGRPIRDTCHFTDAVPWEQFTPAALEALARPIERPLVRSLDANWRNYYHWLIIGLGRAMVYNAVTRRDAALILFPYKGRHRPEWPIGFSHDVYRRSLELSGLGRNAVYLQNGVYKVRSLDLVWLNVDQPPFVSYLPQLYPAFQGMIDARDDVDRLNLIVARPHDPRVNPQTAAALEALCDSGLYRSVALETLGFDEQLDLFARAATIVAPHGAGLANAVFAPKSAKLVELNQRIGGESYLRPWFSLLATGTGQRYAYLDMDSDRERCSTASIHDRLVELAFL